MLKLKRNLIKIDLGRIWETFSTYQEVARRLGIIPEKTNIGEVNLKDDTNGLRKIEEISVTVTLKKMF